LNTVRVASSRAHRWPRASSRGMVERREHEGQEPELVDRDGFEQWPRWQHPARARKPESLRARPSFPNLRRTNGWPWLRRRPGARCGASSGGRPSKMFEGCPPRRRPGPRGVDDGSRRFRGRPRDHVLRASASGPRGDHRPPSRLSDAARPEGRRSARSCRRAGHDRVHHLADSCPCSGSATVQQLCERPGITARPAGSSRKLAGRAGEAPTRDGTASRRGGQLRRFGGHGHTSPVGCGRRDDEAVGTSSLRKASR